MRAGLAGVGIVAWALASCATIPTPQDANDAVLMLRKYDAWAWAVGIALICADLVLPVPQTVVIAALGIIYGTVLGGLLGSVGLITGGLLGYVLMLTSARRMVKRFVSPWSLNTMECLFERAGAWAIVLTRSLPDSTPEQWLCWRALRACPWEDSPRHCRRQRAHCVCVCGDRRRLGRPANPGRRGELRAPHPVLPIASFLMRRPS